MSPANTNQALKTTLCFSIDDKIGGLENCLAAIKGMDISLTRIESYVILIIVINEKLTMFV